MINCLSILLLILCCYSNHQAQYFGGPKNDKGVSFCQNGTDFFLAGTTRSFGAGSDDMTIVHVNSNWEATSHIEWGGIHFDVAADIITTSDGHYLITGHSWDAPGGRSTIVLAKYTTSSNLVWVAYFGDWHNDYVYSVKETSDQGYLLTGIDRAQGILGSIFLTKIDANGHLLWQKFYETPNKDIGMDVVESADHSLFILATTNSFIGEIANSSEYFGDNASDVLVIKTDPDGNEIWRKTYGGVKHDFARKIVADEYNQFYFVGSSMEQTNGSFDISLHKIDENGNVIWRKNFGGTGYEYGNDLAIDNTGNLLITGTSSSFSQDENPDIYVLKLDPNGDEIWSTTLGGDDSDYGNAGQFLPDGTIAILGSSKSHDNNDLDFYFVLLSEDGIITKQLNNQTKGTNTYYPPIIFPNPASSYILIDTRNNTPNKPSEFSLYSTSGQLVLQETFASPSATIYLEDRLAQGVYIYQLKLDDNIIQGKIIINQ